MHPLRIIDSRISQGTNNREGEDTVFYAFQNVNLVGSTTALLEADIVISANEVFEFSSGEIIISYNPAVFGSNIVQNGNLTVSDGVLINGNSYALTTTDLNPNTVSIKIEYIGSGGRSNIHLFPQQLVHASVNVTNFFQTPDVEFESPDMQGQSSYFNGTTDNLFDVVKVSDGISSLSSQAGITDLSPSEVSAGDRDNSFDNLLEISGFGFGMLGPNDPTSQAKVTFTNGEVVPGSPLPFGFLQMDAVECDIIFWADDLIRIHVPSRNENGDTDNYTAGTGLLSVTTDDGSLVSNPQLPITVRYALSNFLDTDIPGTQCFPVPNLLINSDGLSGGYIFQFGAQVFHQQSGATFSDLTIAKEAFARALSTWRCSTGVNFGISSDPAFAVSNPNDGMNVITFEPFFVGLLNQAITHQKLDINQCSGSINHAPVVDIDIAFKDDFNWYFGTGNPAISQLDFETICLHELGHAIGLDHTNNTFNNNFSVPIRDVMYPIVPLGANGVLRELTVNDIDGGSRAVEIGQIGDPNCSFANLLPIPASELCQLTITNSITGIKEIQDISVYPNPFNNQLFIDLEVLEPTLSKFHLLNSLGEIVASSVQNQMQPGSHSLQLEWDKLADLCPGVYFLHFITETGQHVRKVVKH
ncbi:MAG: T9SS type A sorting domain-containing protein [Ekhidna sp.]|nr:T9SS type A sorting domain-containing protein [Ekhidna sp.]